MFKAGIIGYGKAGKRHAGDIMINDKLDLVCVSDVVTQRMLNDDIVFYNDYKKMLLDNRLDCVFVCVPHTMTAGIVLDCVRSGVNVFAEKPPGLCLDDVQLMREGLLDDIVLQFGFNHRYYQHVQLLRDMIMNERFGRLLWFKGVYGRTRNEGWRLKQMLGGKGIFISQGIHMLDLVLWLTGHYKGIDKLGVVGSTVSHYKHPDWFEDNVFVLLKSVEGITGTIHSSCSLSKNVFNMWYQFEKGWVEIRGVNTSTKSFDFPERLIYGETDDSFYYGNPPFSQIIFEKDHSWNVELDNFVSNMQYKKKGYDCSVDEMLSLMRLVDEIYA